MMGASGGEMPLDVFTVAVLSVRISAGDFLGRPVSESRSPSPSSFWAISKGGASVFVLAS